MSQINPSEEKDEVKAGEGTDWNDVANSARNLSNAIHNEHGGDSSSDEGGSNDEKPGSSKSHNGDSPNKDNPSQSGNSPNAQALNNSSASPGIKPGDIAGETGKNTASQAGASLGGSEAASAVGGAAKQATETGAEVAKEAAQTGAEVAKAAAEGAAEGSVVPGVGTVVVAGIRVAWSLRKVIVRIVACLLIVILIPICALETLGEAIWTNAFDENGKEIADASVTGVYQELEKVVQGVIDDAYADAKDRAKDITKQAKYSRYPEFNEIQDTSGGSKLNTDVCDVIATFTVMCKVQGKEPTAKYLKECLEKKKADFFPIEKVEMLKFYYNEYELISPCPYSGVIMGVMKGEEYDAHRNGIYGPDAEEIGSSRTLGGSISYWQGPFYITGSTVRYYYAMTEDSLYKVSGKEIASNEGKPDVNQYVTLPNFVGASPLTHYNSNTQQFGYIINNSLYTPGWQTSGTYAKEKKHYFSEEGYDCVRAIIKPFDRNAMMNCFSVDKNAPYPLVSDIKKDDAGFFVTIFTGSNNEYETAVRDKNYTSDKYLCGMAITDYTDVLKSELFGSQYGIAPAENVMVYEYKVKTILGKPVSGVTVKMFSDEACTQLVAISVSNSDGIAKFTGFSNQVYYFKETAKPQDSLYVLKRGTTKLDNTDGHCATWNFKVSNKGFICPLQPENADERIVITSYFGYRKSPTAGASSMHGGLDMCIESNKGGNLTYKRYVRAAADGKVIVSQEGSGYGYYIQIQHSNGFTTLYAHNSQLLVKAGDTVKQGQIISYAGGVPGTPGAGTSTGAHCHFEVRNADDTRLNPLNFLPLGSN